MALRKSIVARDAR